MTCLVHTIFIHGIEGKDTISSVAEVTRIWIEPGCICCAACAVEAPAVFLFEGATAEIKGSARVDGITSTNEAERSPLRLPLVADAEVIESAVRGCPVEVIHLD